MYGGDLILESIVAEFPLDDTPAPAPAPSPAVGFDAGATTRMSRTCEMMGMAVSWQSLHPSAADMDDPPLEPLFAPIQMPWCAPSLEDAVTDKDGGVNDHMENGVMSANQVKWGHCRAPSQLEGYQQERQEFGFFDIVCPMCSNADLYDRVSNPGGTLEMLPGGAGKSRRTFICKKSGCAMCTWSQRMHPDDEFSDKYGADDKHITFSKKKEISKPSGASNERTRLPVTCPLSLGGCNRAFVLNLKGAVANQTIYRLGGTGAAGARNAFLCQSSKGGCGVRWAQRIYFADGEHEDADPRVTRSKAKAPWEKEKRVNGRMPPKNDRRMPLPPKKKQKIAASHLTGPELVDPPPGCCAGCKTVLPLEDKTDVATQCSICWKWYCDNEDGYQYCSSTMTYDPANSYQPVCMACYTAAL